MSGVLGSPLPTRLAFASDRSLLFMSGTGRSWTLAILVFVVAGWKNERTFVAPTSSTEEEKGTSLSQISGGYSGAQIQALEDINSITWCTPRISCSKENPEHGSSGLVLPVSCNRRAKQWKPVLVLQLRSSLYYGEMVAADNGDEEEIEQPKERRQKEARAFRWEGEVRTQCAGALWNRRDEGNDTMGGDYTNPRSISYATTSRSDAGGGRIKDCGRQGQGQERCDGEDREPETGASAERDQRCNNPCTTGGSRASNEGCNPNASCSSNSQNSSPAPKNGETNRIHQDTGTGIRHQVAEMERVHEGEIHRARQLLQDEAEGAQRQVRGVEDEVGSTPSRSQEGCKRGEHYHRGRLHGGRRSILRRPGASQQFRRRETITQSKAQDTDDQVRNQRVTSEGSEDEHLVNFDEKVVVQVMDDETEVDLCFTVTMQEMNDWSSKPWSLHGGAFMKSASVRLLRIAAISHTGDLGHEAVRARPEDDGLDLRDGGDLSWRDGGQGEEGDIGARGDTGAHVHSGKGEQELAIVHTFGILGGYLGKRSKRVGAAVLEDMGRLREVVRALWTGFADEGFDLHIPQPQPPKLLEGDFAEKFVLVNFLQMNDPMHHERVPVLCDVYGWKSEKRERNIFASMLRSPQTCSCERFDASKALHSQAWESMHPSSWSCSMA